MSDSLLLSIVKALAEADGTEPTDLGYTLEAHIDTDALAGLAAHETTSWMLTFEVPDHVVTVRGDGCILVDGHEEGTWERSHNTSASHS